MRTVSNSEDVMDSRDVIKRLEELQSDLDDLQTAVDDAEEGEEKDDAQAAIDDWDDRDEYNAIKSFAEEGENATSEWTSGETLIRESYWVEYVEEMLKDIGDLPRDIPWYIEIDWEKTAANIAADYTTIDFDGVTYYIRSC